MLLLDTDTYIFARRTFRQRSGNNLSNLGPQYFLKNVVCQYGDVVP